MKVTINGQERAVPVVEEDKLEKNENWRKFEGKLTDRAEIDVTLKGVDRKYWKYSDEEGKTFETWSDVTDHLLHAAYIAGEEVALYYEIRDDNYTKGKKLVIVSVQTKDGWQVGGSKKQGRGDYTRGAALQAAASIYMGSMGESKAKEILKMADEFVVWLKAE